MFRLPEIVYLWTNKPHWSVISSPYFSQLRFYQVDPPSWIMDDYRWQWTILLTAHCACAHIFRWNPLTCKAQYFAPKSRKDCRTQQGISGVKFSVSQVFCFWEILFNWVKGMEIFLHFKSLFRKNFVYWPARTLVKTTGQINSDVS